MGEGLNRVVLFGNLVKSPELRKTSGGRSLANLVLATNHSFVNREGTREERVEFHRVVVWGTRAEGLSRILHKGSFVLVEGDLRTRSWEKEGQRHYMTEVNAHSVILGGRCGPSAHREASAMTEAEADRLEEMETMRDDVEPQAVSGRRPRDSERPPYGEDERGVEIDPTPSERPPRGSSGSSGAPVPPPPPPRRKGRTHASQATFAA